MDKLTIFIFIGLILVFGIGLLVFLTRKGVKTGLDKEKYQVQWLKIMNNFNLKDNNTFELAVLNADKLVALALEELGVEGQTMGERLKNSKTKFSNLNGIWTAHKLRNKIAHETDLHLKKREVKFALVQFKKALKDLGAI